MCHKDIGNHSGKLQLACTSMYQPTTKRHSLSADEVIRCIYKHLESLPDTSSEIFDLYWKPCQTLFLSLCGIRLSPKQARRVNNGQLISSRLMDNYRNSPTIKFCDDLFPAHRCPSVIKFQVRLECASADRSNVLLISKAYFPAYKMN